MNGLKLKLEIERKRRKDLEDRILEIESIKKQNDFNEEDVYNPIDAITNIQNLLDFANEQLKRQTELIRKVSFIIKIGGKNERI